MSARRKFLIFFFASAIFLFFPKVVSAQVVINEFSVEPSDKQDWIEIYSPEIIDISGWKVGDEAGVFFTVPEGTSLGPNVYYIVSKYQRLNNDKDTIFLYDQNGNEKDSIKYGYEGEVCLPSPDGSIARIPDGANTYDRLLNHTKGQTNGLLVTDPCPIPTPTPTPTPAPTNTPTPGPTNTPTPTSKPPTPTPTKKPTPTPTLTLTPTPTGEVLGEETATPTPEPTEPPPEEQPRRNLLPFILIGSGLLLLAGSAVPLILPKFKKGGILKKDEEVPKVD